LQAIFRGVYSEPGVEEGLSTALRLALTSMENRVVVVCIGTDAYIPDALGPLVGTMLTEMGFSKPLYGTLDNPVHAKNLIMKLPAIRSSHPECLQLAIDASLGKKDEIGIIEVRKGGVYPGKALQKRLPQVGQLSIIGKVGSLQGNTRLGNVPTGRLNLIYQMAQVLAKGLIIWEREQSFR